LLSFNQADSRLLVVDSGVNSGMKGNRIVFRGAGLGPAVDAPASYVGARDGLPASIHTWVEIDHKIVVKFVLVAAAIRNLSARR
jgi:hypothetical protein